MPYKLEGEALAKCFMPAYLAAVQHGHIRLEVHLAHAVALQIGLLSAEVLATPVNLCERGSQTLPLVRTHTLERKLTSRRL